MAHKGEQFLTIAGVGNNCNMKLLSGLRNFTKDDMHVVVEWIFSTKKDMWTPATVAYKPMFLLPSYAILIFAHGSDDCITTMTYAADFAEFIQENKLGSVVTTGPAQNPLHRFRPGCSYMWLIDREAVTNWYQLNVTQKRKAEEKAAAQKQAELNAVAVQINNDIRKAEGAADEIHF